MDWRIGELELRPAQREDMPLLFGLIYELAEFEGMTADVHGDAQLLEKSLFDTKAARALIATVNGETVGMAVWFYNFSTFECKPGLYLEDIYIRPAHRHSGYGRKILTFLASMAVEEGCARMEWSVLDWNENAIDFYRKIGAVPLSEWTVYRLTGDALIQAASGERT